MQSDTVSVLSSRLETLQFVFSSRILMMKESPR